jgi:hypothetical protein
MTILLRDADGNIINGSFNASDFGNGQLIAYTGTAGVIANPVWTNKGTLTSDNTTPSDGDTVVIGTKTYTFKTTLTPTEGQVLINASADGALLNLIRAINHTGTADTDYKCAAVNPDVIADAAVVAHSFQVYQKTAAAAVATTTPITHGMSWGAAATGGGKTGGVLAMVMCSTAAYIAVGTAPTATTKNIPMAAGIPAVIGMPAGSKVSAVQAASGGNLSVIEMT